MSALGPALTDRPPVEDGRPAPRAPVAGRGRVDQPASERARRDGRFFRVGGVKLTLKGVTYGPFALDAAGLPLPPRERVVADFDLLRELNANALRVYHAPPAWFLDLAHERGLRVMVDVAWPKNLNFAFDARYRRQARDAVRAAAETCGRHPATFALSVANEFPSDMVRYAGHDTVEDFVDELVGVAKSVAPDCLCTFASYPPTEYLRPRDVDFVTFNVYLHDEGPMRNYLARLQHVAGEKPLVLGEYGVDTLREGDEARQAEVLPRQLAAAYEEGVAGAFAFAFTDDWVIHGYRMSGDWAFGLTREDRAPKPAFARVADVFRRAPQVTEGALPKASVVVCSYNGASTTESCLASMRRIRYPGEYEVVFVDDGSTDDTQEILARFPEVVNVRQKNMGLSFARNVGMQTATGELVVYTDSDCEADEDWLYYLALAITRGGHVGAGGPNLIPDEGSWVADAVGLSPGGPTHVMMDDREAEHVPGCNMGYWRSEALAVGGFDAQFRKAGDDVDFIWRLQHRGGSIGFAPSAQVWHYRRNTVAAYLKQQRGYGEAEALLKYKHPDHFNTLGAGLWRGRIYGADVGLRFGGDVIYHGVMGTGLFQTIYRRPASLTAAMLMSVEWTLLALFVFVLGLAYRPLIAVAVLMLATPMVLAALAAHQADLPPRRRHPLSRLLIAYLHWRQPIARGMARYTVRLKQKSLSLPPPERSADLPWAADEPGVLLYWSKHHDRMPLLKAVADAAREARLRFRLDAGWRDFDLEIYGSRYAKARIATATEDYGGEEGRTTRVRVRARMTTFNRVILAFSILLALFLLLMAWPFSRPAALIPLAAYTMFLVNRQRVLPSVVDLVDRAARDAGYYPVPPKKAEP